MNVYLEDPDKRLADQNFEKAVEFLTELIEINTDKVNHVTSTSND
jgi:hypothetical protein